jgi:hypothetical protein
VSLDVKTVVPFPVEWHALKAALELLEAAVSLKWLPELDSNQ